MKLVVEMSDIKKHVYANGFAYAIEMIEAIEKKAKRNPPYAAKVQNWLINGGTVLLRDEICSYFKSASFIDYAKIAGVPLPFENMWQALDSARLALATRPHKGE